MQREETVEFSEWDDLWSLLAVITLRKCGHRAAYYQAACRDVRRESMSFANGDEADAGWEAIAREPTPLEAMMLGDTVAEMLRSLDERDRELATLALQGFTRQEIAEQIGCTERTVYRVLERLRRHLERSTDGTP